MDVYEYFETMKEEGYSGEAALSMYLREREEYERDLIEELEERQLMTEYQQDLIDMRRFER